MIEMRHIQRCVNTIAQSHATRNRKENFTLRNTAALHKISSYWNPYINNLARKLRINYKLIPVDANPANAALFFGMANT